MQGYGGNAKSKWQTFNWSSKLGKILLSQLKKCNDSDIQILVATISLQFLQLLQLWRKSEIKECHGLDDLT